MTPPPHAVTRLLREPDFLRIWSTGALSMTMRWMEILVIGVYTHEATHSAFTVATMLFARMCPTLLFGAFAGAIAERLNRKWLLVGGLGIAGLVSVILGVLAFTGRVELWHIGLGAFVSGMFWSIEFPSRRTLLGDIARIERVGTAMGLDSATTHASRMVGPAIGGLLLETSGLAGPYFLAALVYVIALLNIATLKFQSSIEATSEDGVLRIIIDGLAYIRTNRLVAGTLVVTMLMNFFGFSYGAMVPVIGESKFGLSAFPIGVLVSIEGIGAMLGALVIAFHSHPQFFPRIYLGGSLLFLVMVILFSFSPWYGLCLPLLFAAGVGLAGFGTMQSAITFSATAPEMRRRVMGVLVVCIGAGPLGVLHTGLMAEWLGADVAIRLIAVEGLLALGFCVRTWPEFYRLRLSLGTNG